MCFTRHILYDYKNPSDSHNYHDEIEFYLGNIPDDIQHYNNVHRKTSPIGYTVMGCCWPMYNVTGTYTHTMT